jgi:hypothetical protein
MDVVVIGAGRLAASATLQLNLKVSWLANEMEKS